MLEHGDAFPGGRVAGPHTGADIGREIPPLERKLLDFAQGSVEVLLHVVRKRLERADVDDFGAGRKRSGNRFAQ